MVGKNVIKLKTNTGDKTFKIRFMIYLLIKNLVIVHRVHNVDRINGMNMIKSCKSYKRSQVPRFRFALDGIFDRVQRSESKNNHLSFSRIMWNVLRIRRPSTNMYTTTVALSPLVQIAGSANSKYRSLLIICLRSKAYRFFVYTILRPLPPKITNYSCNSANKACWSCWFQALSYLPRSAFISFTSEDFAWSSLKSVTAQHVRQVNRNNPQSKNFPCMSAFSFIHLLKKQQWLKPGTEHFLKLV